MIETNVMKKSRESNEFKKTVNIMKMQLNGMNESSKASLKEIGSTRQMCSRITQSSCEYKWKR